MLHTFFYVFQRELIHLYKWYTRILLDCGMADTYDIISTSVILYKSVFAGWINYIQHGGQDAGIQRNYRT